MGEFLKNLANRNIDDDIFADERPKRGSGGPKNSIKESQARLRALSKAGMSGPHPHRAEQDGNRSHPLFD